MSDVAALLAQLANRTDSAPDPALAAVRLARASIDALVLKLGQSVEATVTAQLADGLTQLSADNESFVLKLATPLPVNTPVTIKVTAAPGGQPAVTVTQQPAGPPPAPAPALPQATAATPLPPLPEAIPAPLPQSAVAPASVPPQPAIELRPPASGPLAPATALASPPAAPPPLADAPVTPSVPTTRPAPVSTPAAPPQSASAPVGQPAASTPAAAAAPAAPLLPAGTLPQPTAPGPAPAPILAVPPAVAPATASPADQPPATVTAAPGRQSASSPPTASPVPASAPAPALVPSPATVPAPQVAATPAPSSPLPPTQSPAPLQPTPAPVAPAAVLAPTPAPQPPPTASAPEPAAAVPTPASPPTATAPVQPLPRPSPPVAPSLPLAQVLADPVQAAARQDTVAPLMARAAAIIANPAIASALPRPVLEAIVRALAGRIDLNRTPLDARTLRDAVLRSGTLQPVPGQPATSQDTLLALRSALSRFLGGEIAAVAPVGSKPPPPLKGEPARAPQPTPVVPLLDAAPEETARELLGHTDAALSRTKLLQQASGPDARPSAAAPAPEFRFEIPMLLGAQTGILQLLVERDGRNRPNPRERGWRMRFALNFSATGEVGADIALLGRAANIALWAAEPATADALEAMLPELAPALTSHGLDIAGLRVRRGAPPRRAHVPGQLLDSAR